MRKHNMNNDNPCGPDCSPANGSGFRNGFPFFDVPCLYYPQYPVGWGYQNNCELSYGIFGISAGNNSELLNYCVNAQDGRSVRLNDDNDSILLQPGKLYSISYHVNVAAVSNLSVVPVIDCVSDYCSASYATANGNGNLSVCCSFLLPVVESPSTLQLQVPNGIPQPEQLSGSVSAVALCNLWQ